jgi:hypothetical protein
MAGQNGSRFTESRRVDSPSLCAPNRCGRLDGPATHTIQVFLRRATRSSFSIDFGFDSIALLSGETQLRIDPRI